MALIKSLLGSFSIATLIVANYDTANPLPVGAHVIEGVVQDKESGKLLKDVYLYTIQGEEEALTNGKGVFKLTTYQGFPVTLNVQDRDYQKQQLIIAAEGQKVTVQLVSK